MSIKLLLPVLIIVF